MHSIMILPTILLLTSAINGATALTRRHSIASLPCNCSQLPGEIVASNTALTQLADTLDTPVVALTASTPLTTAQQIPTSLKTLTNAIAANESTPTTNFGAPPPEDTVVRSYGVFANTVEELMFDYARQKGNLAGVFGLQSAMYGQLLAFNTTFHCYAEVVLEAVHDTAHRIIIGYITGNATTGIDSAVESYAP